jgi:hypothetical protein
MMLISLLILVMAFNGGLYLGTIIYTAYNSSIKCQAFLSERGINHFI